jgi:hypothetical protein
VDGSKPLFPQRLIGYSFGVTPLYVTKESKQASKHITERPIH